MEKTEMKNEKLISSIVKNLDRIRLNNFDETHIKNLLIEIRDCNLKSDGILKEICHFVAHPTERDQGLCLNEVDALYFQLKHVNIPPYKGSKLEIDQINKREISIIRYLINKTPDEFFKEINFTKSKATHFFNQCYDKQGRLKSSINIQKLIAILNLIIRIVIPNGVFTQSQFIGVLIEEIKAILNSSKVFDDYSEDILKIQNNVFVCVLSLLQDANFKLYDKSFAKVKISISNINEMIKSNSEPETINLNAVFNVPYMSDGFSVTIIKSNIYFKDYFDENLFEIEKNNFKTFESFRDSNNDLLLKKV